MGRTKWVSREERKKRRIAEKRKERYSVKPEVDPN